MLVSLGTCISTIRYSMIWMILAILVFKIYIDEDTSTCCAWCGYYIVHKRLKMRNINIFNEDVIDSVAWQAIEVHYEMIEISFLYNKI